MEPQTQQRVDDPNMSTRGVTKVGAAVLRAGADGELEVLAIQPRPKPKTPEDLPPIGLVRGTRMYRDAAGNWVDADHDGSTLPADEVQWEPVSETLAREIEEEAGIARTALTAAQVIDMGVRLFASRKKTPYPIHWFVVVLDDAAQAAITHTGLKDSLSTQWVTREGFAALVADGKASAGYLPVIEEARNMVE